MMSRESFGRRLGVRSVVAVVLALVLAGLAWGQLASSDVIQACVGNDSRQVRIPADGDSCKNNETAIDWNRTGPQGAPGQAGQPGEQGPPGIAGVHKVTATGTGPQVSAYCPAGEEILGAPGYIIARTYPGGSTFGGQQPVQIVWVEQFQRGDTGPNTLAHGIVQFATDQSQLGPGEAIEVSMTITCARVG